MERGTIENSHEDRRRSVPARKLRMVVPDGHLQDETRDILSRAGYKVKGYEKDRRIFRPELVDEDKRRMIEIKAVRDVPPKG